MADPEPPQRPFITFRNSGMHSRDPVEIPIGPVRLSIEEGTAAVDGIPGAAHIRQHRSMAAERMAEMAIHEHSLLEAEAAGEALQELTIDDQNSAIGRALHTAMVITYTRCFANTPHKLDASEIFDSTPRAMRAHQYHWELRSKHHAHDINDRRASFTVAILDARGGYLATGGWQGFAESPASDLDNLRLLVAQALMYVRKERMRLDTQIARELDSMSDAERLSLPEPVLIPPTPATVKAARRPL